MGNIWQGELVQLKGLEPDDWHVFHAWNDRSTDALRATYYVDFPRSAAATMAWSEQTALRPPENDSITLKIAPRNTDDVAGIINSHSCDARVGTFSYGVAILPDYRHRGYAADAIRVLLSYFFNERRYQKCTVDIYEFNLDSIRLHERLGFQQEGRLRRMVYTDGLFYDKLYYGITREEFESQYG